MKKNRILIYSSLLALFGSCSVEEIDQQFNINTTDSVVPAVSNNCNLCENGLSAAYGYNAFVQNGITIESGDTEGAIALGGDLTVNGSFTVATQSAGAFFHNDEDLAASLVVNGKIIYSSSEGINLNQGYLKIGDLTGSNVYDLDNNNVATNTRVTPGDYNETPRILLQRNQILESIDAPAIIDFDAAFAELNNASLELSNLTNNISIENGNKITLAADTVNVLNITGEELNNLTNFTFNNKPNADSPLIINIDQEGEFIWDVQNQAGIGDDQGDFIVYNFYNSTQITIQRTTVIGSVLAPSSDVIKKSSDNINGQVIAKSYIHMNGELHQHPYVYCPTDEEIETPEIETETPEDEETVCSLAVELVKEVGEGTFIYADPFDETLTYEWSTGSTNSFIDVFPTETTTYSVIVSDQNGCSVTESITIEIKEIEEEEEEDNCSLTVNLVAEIGEGTVIYVDPFDETFSYEWSNGSTQSFIDVFQTETTTYTVIVSDQNGCSVTESITVE